MRRIRPPNLFTCASLQVTDLSCRYSDDHRCAGFTGVNRQRPPEGLDPGSGGREAEVPAAKSLIGPIWLDTSAIVGDLEPDVACVTRQPE